MSLLFVELSRQEADIGLARLVFLSIPSFLYVVVSSQNLNKSSCASSWFVKECNINGDENEDLLRFDVVDFRAFQTL